MSDGRDQKRVGLYLRVSTDEQSTDLQQRELTEYCKRRGWGIAKIYEDKASGTSAKNRKMLAELMTDCQRRNIDLVLVWKLDRLFRSLKMMIEYLSQMSHYGVDFISITDSIDLSNDSPAARLQLHLLSAFSEFEASLIKSRVVAGLRAAKARGQKLGRPGIISASMIEQVKSLREQGLSIRAIERELNGRASRATVERILKGRK